MKRLELIFDLELMEWIFTGGLVKFESQDVR